jgi:hypothetical protein
MAVKPVVTAEELKSLSEDFQKEYVEREGAYFLNVAPVTIKGADGKERKLALEDVTGLKDALAEERTKVQELGRQVKRFEGITDPQAALEALTKVKEWGDAAPDEQYKKQLEATKEQLESRYRGELEALTAKVKEGQSTIEKLQSESNDLVLQNAASTALTKAGVLPDAHDMMVEQICKTARCRKVDFNGKPRHVVEVFDERGNVRITNMSNSTDPMGLDELAKELKAGRHAFAFKGIPAAGSGAGSAGSVHLPPGVADLDPVERLKAARRAQAAQ